MFFLLPYKQKNITLATLNTELFFKHTKKMHIYPKRIRSDIIVEIFTANQLLATGRTKKINRKSKTHEKNKL